MPTARPQQSSTASPLAIVIIGGVIAVSATIVAGPAGPLIGAATAAIAGACATPPELTGKRDTANRPTPANDAEQAKLTSYGMWHALTIPVLALGGKGIIPTKGIRLTWIGAIGAALLTLGLPCALVDLPYLFNSIGAVFAFSLVAGIDHALRVNRHPADPCPGVSVKDVLNNATVKVWCALTAGSVIPAALSAWATLMPAWEQRSFYPLASTVTTTLGVALIGGAVSADLAVRKPALLSWNQTVQTRAAWEVRWASLKTDPAPRLVSHEQLSDTLHIDTFETTAIQGGSAAFIGNKPASQLVAVMGPGVRATPTEVPSLDPTSGQPVPGTIHPLRFKVIAYLDGQITDITAPDADPAQVQTALEFAMGAYCDAYNYRHPPFLSLDRVSGEGDPSVWAVRWAPTPVSVSYAMMRSQASDAMAGTLNAPVITDHRAEVMFAGDLWNKKISYVEDTPQPMRDPRTPSWESVTRYFETVRDEAVWDSRWEQAMKLGMPTPRPDFHVYAEGYLAGGQRIEFLPFVTKQGVTPDDYYGLAPKLSTTLAAAPFCAVTSFPQGPASNGERHPQAVSVMWSSQQVPTSPRALTPKGPRASDAERWVLTDMLERAFVAAKLPRPQITQVRPLTKAGARESIWNVTMRLLDGATLEAARLAQTKLASGLSVPWLRIAKGQRDGFIDIAMGALPASATLCSPRDEQLVTSLDWEQAWADAGIIGAGGLVPKLIASDRLPHNEEVQVLDFHLPSPVNVQRIRAGVEKLKSATGNLFLDIRPGDDGADYARILACPIDPMPTAAGYDFEVIDAMAAEGKERIAFATGVEGEPVTWNTKTSPHVMVAGGTGSGKSALMQSLMVDAIVSGWDFVIIDPSKGAADFRFAEPYAKAVATTVPEAGGVMGLVYAEVVRRKDLNSKHGVGSFRDLPDDVRPVPFVVFLDEFTSLITQEPAGKPSDDVEVENERQKILTANAARARIGTHVGKIAREARSAGVILVLGTQKLNSKILENVPGSTDLRANMARVLLGKATYGDKMSALRDPDSCPDLGETIPPGRGIWEPSDGQSTIIQSWYDPGEQAFLTAELAERVSPLDVGEKWDMSRFEEKETGPSVREIDEDDIVVDLGEESFSLEQLGLDDEPRDDVESEAAVDLEVEPDAVEDPIEFEVADEDDSAPLSEADLDAFAIIEDGPASAQGRTDRADTEAAEPVIDTDEDMTPTGTARLGALNSDPDRSIPKTAATPFVSFPDTPTAIPIVPPDPRLQFEPPRRPRSRPKSRREAVHDWTDE